MPRRPAALLTCLLAVAACGGQPAETAGPGAAAATGPGTDVEAVATVFPLAWMAEQIAPGAEVVELAADGQDPHDLELSPSHRALVESADVVVYLGDLGFQPQVEAAVPEAGGQVVAAAEVAGDRVRHVEHGHEDEHADEHEDGHEDEGGTADARDGAAAADPHLWFDAEVMGEVAVAVGEAFAAADPAEAEAYRGNARQVQEELAAVAEDIDAALSGCAHDTAIVSHEAYGYLLEPRGLEQEGISGVGGHGGASPQRLAELTQRIREEGIPAVVTEPVEGREDAEALAAEAGVDLVEIDPLEGADETGQEIGYPQLLREQAAAFAGALGCG